MQWGAVADVGMAARCGVKNDLVSGLQGSLTTRQCFAILFDVLCRNVVVVDVVVSTSNWAVFERILGIQLPLLRGFTECVAVPTRDPRNEDHGRCSSMADQMLLG